MLKSFLYASLIRLFVLTLPVLACSQPLLAAKPAVKMVVTAAFVSDKGLPVYEQLATYVSQKLSRPVDVISGISYEESNLLLEKGIIQVGFVCGLPYTQQHRQNKLDLVAIPVMAGTPTKFEDAADYSQTPGKYFSYTIVHKDSPIESWVDLKGKSYVYNEQTSNSGYNMPRYRLIAMGAKSFEEYFSRVEVSGSHEESIRMVSRGLVDASSVDSLVLDYDRHLGDPDALNVKIIEVMFAGGAGIPPVVLSTSAPASLKKELQDVLLNMHHDPQGKRILDKSLLLRFDAADDTNYNDVRGMEAAARQVGFRDHRIK